MESLTFYLPEPVHVADFGGTGRLIVLLHGIGGNHTNWWSLGPQLARHGRVLAVDLVGCGYTEPLGRSCRLTTNAQIVTRLLQQLGTSAILVGHSMGGLLSLLLSAQEPGAVESLVLIDPSQRGESPRPNPQFIAQLLLPSVPVLGDRAVKRLVGTRTPAERVHDAWAVSMVDQSRVSPAARRAAVDVADYWFSTPWHRQSILTAISSTGRALVDPRRYGRAVKSSTCPTMVIHGAQDHMISSERIEKLKTRRPDWNINFIADAGHNPHLETPDEVMALIDEFLAQPQAAATDQP